MNLVDDINATFHFGRGINHRVAKVADVVNAVVACRVYLVYIKGAFCRKAGGANSAGVTVLGIVTAYRL